MNKKIKIYFLGSGPIAVPVLTKLQHSPNLELLGVATQPDRQAGRKRQLLSTPVGTASDAAGTPALRVENVNDPDFLDMLKKLDVDFVLVVSFGQLLKADLLNLPRYGCINVHASILPRYRGASPISTAIANQDSETGVTFMKMDRGLDTGDIYQIITQQKPQYNTTYS